MVWLIPFVWQAAAAPMGDRQIQIEWMGLLETAETATQETVPKLTRKTIKHVTEIKQNRAKGPQNIVPNQFVSRMLF